MKWKRWLLLLLIAACWIVPAAAVASAPQGENASAAKEEAGKTAVIYIDRTIETGLQRYLERSLKEAEAIGAETAVLVINTLGGSIEAAEGIGEAIRSSSLRTIAYVQGRAISAGSFIALNADEIYMHPAASIGSAAVVTLSGERVTDSKTVAAWSSAMRAAAEMNGRNPEIAEGMVDDSKAVELPEINRTFGAGQLISLTADEALAVGYAEGKANSLDELLAALGAESVEYIEPTPAEQLARFLTNPAVATILLILGMAGILIELLVPGFGFPGIIGVASFTLYFLGNFVAGFAGMEHMALFIAGIVLLVLELFVPSFGILGGLGVLALLSGVVLAAYDTGDAWKSLGIAAAVSALIIGIVVKYFKHRGVWNKFILSDALKTDEGYVSHDEREDLVGQVGRAVTPLRPSGTVLLGDERIDVVTEGEFLPAGTEVQVVRIEGIRIVVRKAPEVHKP